MDERRQGLLWASTTPGSMGAYMKIGARFGGTRTVVCFYFHRTSHA